MGEATAGGGAPLAAAGGSRRVRLASALAWLGLAWPGLLLLLVVGEMGGGVGV